MAKAEVIQSRISLTVYAKTNANVTPLRVEALERDTQEFVNNYMKTTFPALKFGTEGHEG